MRIVNPAFGRVADGDAKSDARPVDWARDPIILFGNAKPNARELLEGARDSLADWRNISDVTYITKDSPAQPAPPEMIEEVARTRRGALLALAD